SRMRWPLLLARVAEPGSRPGPRRGAPWSAVVSSGLVRGSPALWGSLMSEASSSGFRATPQWSAARTLYSRPDGVMPCGGGDERDHYSLEIRPLFSQAPPTHLGAVSPATPPRPI